VIIRSQSWDCGQSNHHDERSSIFTHGLQSPQISTSPIEMGGTGSRQSFVFTHDLETRQSIRSPGRDGGHPFSAGLTKDHWFCALVSLENSSAAWCFVLFLQGARRTLNECSPIAGLCSFDRCTGYWRHRWECWILTAAPVGVLSNAAVRAAVLVLWSVHFFYLPNDTYGRSRCAFHALHISPGLVFVVRPFVNQRLRCPNFHTTPIGSFFLAWWPGYSKATRREAHRLRFLHAPCGWRKALSAVSEGSRKLAVLLWPHPVSQRLLFSRNFLWVVVGGEMEASGGGGLQCNFVGCICLGWRDLFCICGYPRPFVATGEPSSFAIFCGLIVSYCIF